MTGQSIPTTATVADIRSLAAKLTQFSADLTSGERAALRDLLERATAESDVQGFGFAAQDYDAALGAAFDPAGAFGPALAERRRSHFASDLINNPSQHGY
jgi:hypothetical protein